MLVDIGKVSQTDLVIAFNWGFSTLITSIRINIYNLRMFLIAFCFLFLKLIANMLVEICYELLAVIYYFYIIK